MHCRSQRREEPVPADILGKRQDSPGLTQRRTDIQIHTYGLFRVHSLPNPHVFGLWEETRGLMYIPTKHIQTPWSRD